MAQAVASTSFAWRNKREMVDIANWPFCFTCCIPWDLPDPASVAPKTWVIPTNIKPTKATNINNSNRVNPFLIAIVKNS